MSRISKLIPAGRARWGVVAAAFVVISLHLFTGVDAAPFHGDEAWWSSAGYYFSGLMFVDHDYSPASWSKKGYYEWGVLSPPAGKYIIGLAMRSVLPVSTYYYPYDFSKDEEQNRVAGTIPPPDVLRPGRLASAAASVLACAAIFAACLIAWDWVVGVAAAIFLAFNGLFTLLGQRAMTDALLICCLSLAVLLCAGLVRSLRSSRTGFFALCLVSGIVAGIACSVKFNGIVAIACTGVTLLYLAVHGVWRRSGAFPTVLAGGALVVAAALGVVIGLNPLYYSASPPEMIARTEMVLDGWDRLLASQQQGNPAQAIQGFPANAIGHLAVEWYSPILFVFAVIGLIRWAGSGLGGAFSKKATPAFGAGVSFIVIFLAVLAWIPLDWDRYYLPLVLSLVPFSALGMVAVADFAVGKMQPGRKN